MQALWFIDDTKTDQQKWRKYEPCPVYKLSISLIFSL